MLALVLLLLLPRTAAGLLGTRQLPAGWAGPIAARSMLHHRPASGPLLDARLRPWSIGNGRLATLAGSANVYLAGVFNLHGGAYEPFRARLPGRYNDANLTLLARTLPLNASHVHVRGLSYRGADLTVEWDGRAASVTCARGGCDAPALYAMGGRAAAALARRDGAVCGGHCRGGGAVRHS
jgi:hypothetical protein